MYNKKIQCILKTFKIKKKTLVMLIKIIKSHKAEVFFCRKAKINIYLLKLDE